MSEHLPTVSWQQQASQSLLAGNYTTAASLYEAAITAEPDIKQHYWQLGLMLLLQGEEVEAQTTWLLAMAEGESDEIEQWTIELVEILAAEAQRQETLTNCSVAWTIRQHIRELNPAEINNLLHLILLSIQLEIYTGEELSDFGLLDLLTEKNASVDSNLLLEVLKKVLDLDPLQPNSYEFAQACIASVENPQTLLRTLLRTATQMRYGAKNSDLAIKFAELCLQINPNNTEILYKLSAFHQDAREFDRGVELAQKYYSLLYPEDFPHRIHATHYILRGLMSAGGRWAEVCSTFDQLESLLLDLFNQEPIPPDPDSLIYLINTTFFFPYFRDRGKENRYLQNQIAKITQSQIAIAKSEIIQRYQQNFLSRKTETSEKKLKIGYISHCLDTHSVGWLARWLFLHHNRDEFEIYAYLVGAKQKQDPLQDWYITQVHKAHRLEFNIVEIAETIFQDEIDILVDLDSITLDITCGIMALKPAPIQVTWLGLDASGLPAIDYFIADPYVLPESAHSYYAEKIWRLPQTYIAVDGFEVGVPTLRREDLEIPSDAVVYFSGQRGFKYHPNTARLQMQIIKAVPNSYFLIKGLGDTESIKKFYLQLAEKEGVNPDQLRFMPEAPAEIVHRANLRIADIVLDTYPYNGATTSLETLWMGIPLVTRVGEQFAARNSYTMLINAGVTEGISWSDEEYVEWGIRFGKDSTLRQKVSWQLRQSRHTSPLWNGKEFAREMEKAYQQMWMQYLQT